MYVVQNKKEQTPGNMSFHKIMFSFPFSFKIYFAFSEHTGYYLDSGITNA